MFKCITIILSLEMCKAFAWILSNYLHVIFRCAAPAVKPQSGEIFIEIDFSIEYEVQRTVI